MRASRPRFPSALALALVLASCTPAVAPSNDDTDMLTYLAIADALADRNYRTGVRAWAAVRFACAEDEVALRDDGGRYYEALGCERHEVLFCPPTRHDDGAWAPDCRPVLCVGAVGGACPVPAESTGGASGAGGAAPR